MPSRKIIIEEYNPAWKEQFEQLEEIYTTQLKNLITGVEHIGSTSIPGLSSKPVLDIDIVISEEKNLQQIISLLEKLGYQFRGDQGIKDRYAFSQSSSHTPQIGTNQVWPRHHLYCCVENSTALNNHLTLRNILRSNPLLRKEYEQLKRDLAASTDDMDTYVEGKSQFIAQLLLQNGFLQTDVEDIILQNKKK